MKGLVVGLTGQTGAGKSTVSRVLSGAGIPVIDCDLLSRQAVRPGSRCLEELIDALGSEILQPDGFLDRGKTAMLVFSDPDKLAALNRITHRAILELVRQEMKLLFRQGAPLLVLDAPTLFESGADGLCQVVVSVIAPSKVRYERILARDSLSPQAAKRRMNAQQPDDFYTHRSEYVIFNDGSLAHLEEKAAALAQTLQKRAGER